MPYNSNNITGVQELAVGEQISRWRKLRGWSQRELARRAAIANGALSQVELGHSSPAVHTLQKVAKALGVTLQALLFDEPYLPCHVVRAGDAIHIDLGVVGSCVYSRFTGHAALLHLQIAQGQKLTSQSLSAVSGQVLDSGCNIHVYDGLCLLVASGIEYSLNKGDSLNVMPGVEIELISGGPTALNLMLSLV
ncbi:helix-turn-helix domain-containing protein [Marinagarivorans algicola]|uniref:helix-turn-helix domain-containing protein n=1 Tax=Marinagarivorans algicola TaxID=1513270 RepID=UPI0012E0EFFB|nr:helix-turn-helix transcriptional regulator [Marinagarivorans algicola]